MGNMGSTKCAGRNCSLLADTFKMRFKMCMSFSHFTWGWISISTCETLKVLTRLYTDTVKCFLTFSRNYHTIIMSCFWLSMLKMLLYLLMLPVWICVSVCMDVHTLSSMICMERFKENVGVGCFFYFLMQLVSCLLMVWVLQACWPLNFPLCCGRLLVCP